MRSEVLPALPMVTTAGLRMYFLASFSTLGGIVAENMYVMRYLVPRLASSPCSSIFSASSSGLSDSADMESMTDMTCGSKPMSIIRSASSSTM